MHSKNRSKLISIGIKTLGMALIATNLMCVDASATGMGKLTVLSALGQPLRAEIELTAVTSDDAGNLVPKLAPVEAYRQANIEYNANLSSLRFDVQVRGGQSYILVTSGQVITEPFVEMLLELNTNSGKLLREYTMLFDPVDLRLNSAPAGRGNKVAGDAVPVSDSAAAAAAANSTVPAPDNVQPQPAPYKWGALPAKSPRVSPKSGTNSAPRKTSPDKSANSVEPVADKSDADNARPPRPELADDYKIRQGDTLGKIAGKYKPDGVSLEQMLVALHRKNPDAFIKNNMNLLRSGRILSMPDTAEIKKTGESEAKKIVVAQSLNFNAYRDKLSSIVSESAPETAPEPKQAASHKITAKVNELPTQESTSQDKLKLSKAKSDAQAKQQASEEDKIIKQKAIDEANARVRELEKNTADLQKILDTKAAAATPVATVPAPASAPAAPPAAAPVPVASANIPASAPAAIISALSTPVESSAPVADVTPPPPVKKAARPALAPPPPEPEPGLFDGLPPYLPYAGGLLALLGLVGIYASKRKKRVQPFDSSSIITDSASQANSLFGSTGGQSVDTNNSVFNSNFAPSASQLDANEVDPVAEADVYIAYGRDIQAEEILKEALRTQPDRLAVRVKLLEIYSNRKDVRAFENVASELYGMTSGAGPDWDQAASMGIALDPHNPLYAGGKVVDHATPMGMSTKPMENLDPEALLGNSLSQEMLDSISAPAQNKPSSILTDVHDKTLNSANHNGNYAGLDFDLGLNTPARNDASAPAAPLPSIPEIPESEHDFFREAGAPATPVSMFEPMAPTIPQAPSVPAAPVAEEAPEELDFAALDFDFDPPSEHVEHISSQQFDRAIAGSETHHGLDTPDHEPEASTPPPPAFSFDLSSIDLDLPKSAPMEIIADAHAPNVISDDQFNAEMATKLDLAIAYQVIGDKDGARELLDEVIKSGNHEQIDRAKNMLLEMV